MRWQQAGRSRVDDGYRLFVFDVDEAVLEERPDAAWPPVYTRYRARPPG